MKNFLLFLVLICGNSFAQSNYTIEKSTFIYDLPGGGLLTAKGLNNKTHIKHYDAAGSVIWEDSIGFQGAVGTVAFRSFSQFMGTDEYIITMTNDLTNYPSYPQNDTLIYKFTKFNISTHQIVNSLIDTIYTIGGSHVNYSDTSIYFFFVDRSISTNGYCNYATYSLNPSMQLSLIAPSDSILAFWAWQDNFYKINDEILYYQKIQDMNHVRRYSNSMSLIAEQPLFLSAGTNYISTLNVTHWNNDSLFIFSEGSTGGTTIVKWRFDWMDTYLNPINSATISSPLMNYPQSSVRYGTSYKKVAIDRANRTIMVLANEMGNFQPEIEQKVFVYDFDFNLKCEFPITIGSKSTNQLMELNDRVYLKITNQNSIDLALIDCQYLGIDEFESVQSDFVLYPNPTSNLLFLDNVDQTTVKIEIYSSDGKLMREITGSESKIIIDLNSLENGIYLVTLESNGAKQTKRVVKI